MNSALLILAQDSRVPEIRAKRGCQTQVLEVDDILSFRVDI